MASEREVREAVASTWAAMLAADHPGTKWSVDVDGSDLSSLPAHRKRRRRASTEEAESAGDRLSGTVRAA